ncbi:MAG: threonylcarbamoyl-AMP synthase [Bacteroidales bacterium]|nr:threonylcarbamoyl-AMP synthase [Bacteroidales bacterium]
MKDDIKNAVAVLKHGGVILYPTDTVWGLGCDATNSKAAQKIYKIKGRPQTSSFIILLENEKKIPNYVKEVPLILGDLLRSLDTPTTIVYPGAKNLPKNVVAKDGTIAIRIIKDEFCCRMLAEFGKPIVSTSANLTGEGIPVLFKDINESIINQVDYAVNIHREKLNKVKASTLIRIKPDVGFEILRQ